MIPIPTNGFEPSGKPGTLKRKLFMFSGRTNKEHKERNAEKTARTDNCSNFDKPPKNIFSIFIRPPISFDDMVIGYSLISIPLGLVIFRVIYPMFFIPSFALSFIYIGYCIGANITYKRFNSPNEQ